MAKAIVLTRPISNCMDHLSLLETVRIRTRLRLQGILSEQSKCTMMPDQFISENMRVLTGDCGLGVLHDFFNILQAPEELTFSEDLQLDQDECLPIVIMAMSDAWRRLVLPYSGMPWCLFRIVDMNSEDGLNFLRSAGMQAGSCWKCQDRCFSTDPRLNYSYGGLVGRFVWLLGCHSALHQKSYVILIL